MNKKKLVILAAIIMAGIVIINFLNKIAERTDEEYISILLDNKEDFDYVAEMIQQWPPGSYIDFNKDSITSGSQIHLADEKGSLQEAYGYDEFGQNIYHNLRQEPMQTCRLIIGGCNVTKQE